MQFNIISEVVNIYQIFWILTASKNVYQVVVGAATAVVPASSRSSSGQIIGRLGSGFNGWGALVVGLKKVEQEIIWTILLLSFIVTIKSSCLSWVIEIKFYFLEIWVDCYKIEKISKEIMTSLIKQVAKNNPLIVHNSNWKF